MLRKLSRIVFSFEMVFVLYLFSGRYKTDPRFDWVPVDLSVFFLAVSVVWGVVILLRRRLHFRRSALVLTGCMMLFIGYCLASYFWTPSEVYSSEKLLALWILVLWSFIACVFVISRSLERLRRFVTALVLFSAWIAVESVLAYSEMAVVGQQVMALGSNYLGLGRVIGLAAIVLLMYGIQTDRPRQRRWVALSMFAGYMVLLLILGGRGPFIAVCLPVFILVCYGIRLREGGRFSMAPYAKSLIASLIAGFGVIWYFASNTVYTTLNRLGGLFSDSSSGVFGTVRMDLYIETLHTWGEHPLFGTGIGGWPLATGGSDAKMYPHNMILEVLSELGIIGLLLLGLLIGVAFNRFRRQHNFARDAWAMLILLLFLNAFLNAMLTEDLTGNRTVFAFLGLFLLESDREATSASRIFSRPDGSKQSTKYA